NSVFNDFEVSHDFPHIGRRTMVLNARRLDQVSGTAPMVLLSIEDVTERQRVAEDLSTTNKQLEAFVYSIAHDLRAPLRSMQGFSALLLTEAKGKLSPTGQDYTERINRSSQFMDESLVGLLNFSHITMQQIELTPINLEAALQSTLTQLEAQIRERQARIEAVGPWPAVLGHEMTLGQVLLNLIGNAIKFVAPNVT